MTWTRIVIDSRFSDGKSKRYHSTQEQIRENQRENEAQSQRDERARSESTGCQNTPTNNNTDRRENAA